MATSKQSSTISKSSSNSLISYSRSNLNSDVILRWKKRRPLPQARDGHVAVAYDNRITLFCGGDGAKWYTESWTYEFDQKKWRICSGVKYPPLWGGTATLLPNNQPLIFGGKDDKGVDQNAVYLFDLDLKTYKHVETSSGGSGSSSLPPPRRLHSANYVNGFIYVFAGRQGTQHYHNDLWKFDLLYSKWSQVYFDPKEPAPCARWDHGSAVVGDTVYIFGGMDQNNKPLGDFWKFETIAQKWTELKLSYLPPPGACKLIGPLTVQKSTVLLLLNDYLTTVWLYDVAIQTWTSVIPTGKGPTWREYYTATVVDNEVYVIGGHERNRVSSEVYQLKWIESVAQLVVKLEKGQQRIEGRLSNIEQQLQQMNAGFEAEIRSLTKQLNDVLSQNDMLIQSLKAVNKMLTTQLSSEQQTNAISEALLTRIQQQRAKNANARRKAVTEIEASERTLKSQLSSHSATDTNQNKEVMAPNDSAISERSTKSATELVSVKSSHLKEKKNVAKSPVVTTPIERTPEQLLRDLHDFFVLVVEFKSKDTALLNSENTEQLNQILMSFPSSCDNMPWKSNKEKQLAVLMLEVVAQSRANKRFLFDASLLKLYSDLLQQLRALKNWETNKNQ
jgi:hypothetical protein